VVGAVTHAAESEDELLQELVDELRGCYQIMAEDLEKQGIELTNERWCVCKHTCAGIINDIETIAKRKREGRDIENLVKAVTLKGKIVQKILESSYEGEREYGEEQAGEEG